LKPFGAKPACQFSRASLSSSALLVKLPLMELPELLGKEKFQLDLITSTEVFNRIGNK